MHASSYKLMTELRACIHAGSTVLDVGGANVGNGSYRALFEDCKYTSLDLKGADINVPGYDWPLEDASFDGVISGQTFEHDPRFWITMHNMARVLKPGGHIVLIVPSAGPVHRYPVDCYRFYPDSMKALADWAHLTLLKTVWTENHPWRDLGAILRKGGAKKK